MTLERSEAAQEKPAGLSIEQQGSDKHRLARAVLEAFFRYDEDTPLGSLLGKVDLSGMTCKAIAKNLLGTSVSAPAPNFDLKEGAERQYLRFLVGHVAFQAHIREIVLHAFPEKRRRIFVHVPKCAGSDLQNTLKHEFPYLHLRFSQPKVTKTERLFKNLHELALDLRSSESIAVCGHVPLRWYLNNQLLRPGDDIFTTIRHPVDIIYSNISYRVTRCVEFRDKPTPDAKQWLASIGLKTLEKDPSPGYLLDIGRQMLDRVAEKTPNVICRYLGNGTMQSALENIVKADIEVSDTTRYSRWRSAKFGLKAQQRRTNKSQPFFRPDMLTKPERDRIEAMVEEDRLLYEKIMAKLGDGDALSVRGSAFA